MAQSRKNSRKVLALLYRRFCDRSMPFLSGISLILTNKHLAELRISYFFYCNFLLDLPQSYRNKKIIRYFGASGIFTSLQKLGSKLEKDYIFLWAPSTP